MLRDPAYLSKAKPHLQPLRQRIRRLLGILAEAPVREQCSKGNCRRTPTSMTWRVDEYNEWLPAAYFWCKKHKPSERHGFTQKQPIDLSIVERIRGRYRNHIARQVLYGLGLPPRARITAKFASSFFAQLREEIDRRDD